MLMWKVGEIMIRYESLEKLKTIEPAVPTIRLIPINTKKIIQVAKELSLFNTEIVQYTKNVPKLNCHPEKDYGRLMMLSTLNTPIKAVILFGYGTNGASVLLLTPTVMTREERTALLLMTTGEHITLPRGSMNERECARRIALWKSKLGIQKTTGLIATNKAVFRGDQIPNITPILEKWMHEKVL